MRHIATVLLLMYLAVLTAGLLVSNPFAIAGSHESWLRDTYFADIDPVGHFVAFLVLGLLAGASRWPARFFTRIALLAAYAMGTEALQALVPPRTPELKDLLENLAGAAVGTFLAWVMFGRRSKPETGDAATS